MLNGLVLCVPMQPSLTFAKATHCRLSKSTLTLRLRTLLLFPGTHQTQKRRCNSAPNSACIGTTHRGCMPCPGWIKTWLKQNLELIKIGQTRPAVQRLIAEMQRLSGQRDPEHADLQKRLDGCDCMCPLCCKLLCQPVTTPCGHTFCRTCFARAMDHSSKYDSFASCD